MSKRLEQCINESGIHEKRHHIIKGALNQQDIAFNPKRFGIDHFEDRNFQHKFYSLSPNCERSQKFTDKG